MYCTSSFYSVFVSWPPHLLPLHSCPGEVCDRDGSLSGVGSSHIELGNYLLQRGLLDSGGAGERGTCILSRLPRIGCIVPAEMFGVQ